MTTESNDPVNQPSGETAPASSVPDSPPVRRVKPARGTGAMGPRLRRDDEAGTPPREIVDAAAATARTTGHRFDLMRYLRLRRRSNT